MLVVGVYWRHNGFMSQGDLPTLLDELYRAHASRLLAVLVRLLGVDQLELAEDVLQDAFRRALTTWQHSGVPDEPAAWLMAAARNRAIDVIRRSRTQERYAQDLRWQLESDWTLRYTVEQEFTAARIRDDQLRMIFMCASAGLSPENRIPLILRTLCGFSLLAISRALLIPVDTVKKRLSRSRERLRGHAFVLPQLEHLPRAMDSVHTVIYLLFNEGFHGVDDRGSLQLDLCREAEHLANLLRDEARIVNRDTLGLAALMRFHLARAATRVDESGDTIPIDRQAREHWDRKTIQEGQELLEAAVVLPAGASDRFFIEAQIAEQHCVAETFEDTDWSLIAGLYQRLVVTTSSPVASLNQAVALAYAGDVTTALQIAEFAARHVALAKSHLPSAVQAHLHAMRGEAGLALEYAARSAARGGTLREQRILMRQIDRRLSAGPWPSAT